MPREYILECTGDAREVYMVICESEEEARELFESGRIDSPVVTECSTAIQNITVAEGSEGIE